MGSSSVQLSSIANLLTGEDVRIQREKVADLLHRNTLHFPGAQPVSFARHHLQELQTRDYFMCEKTDGVRCLLYLTTIEWQGAWIEAQFLIDRKNDYYFVPRDTLHIPANTQDVHSYHLGTVLDGELVRQRPKGQPERLAYLIFDLLAIDNEDVMARPFDKRLARIDQFIWKPLKDFAKRWPQEIAAQPFQVEMKKMEFPYGMEMMFRDRIPNLPHGNDGLIFTCKETAYKHGTDENILKWKPPVENTIDFRLILGEFPWVEDEDEAGGGFEDWDGKPEMELHVNHGKAYEFFASLSVTDTEWTAMKALNQQIDGRIIECYRDPTVKAKDVWRPKVDDGSTPRFRDDKTDANHISTVVSVLDSIRDAVTEQDLIAAAGPIRTAFKARQKAREEEQKKAEEAERLKKRQEAQKRESEVKEEIDDGPRYEE